MPEPKTKQELERFMGMIQYLSNFITRLSEKSAPHRALLKKNAAWYWNHEHQGAVQVLKEECSKQPTLRYYDGSKPVRISADSSKSGLGAVCLQEEQPVAYASRALTEAQQRYAQIEKKLLAIVFACEKCHQYISSSKKCLKPVVLMSDNGLQFCCKQFKEFQQKWEFAHITSSPVYPQSNGGVERAVKIAKSLMKKAFED